MFKHSFDDPLRAIYKDIIQPLIGDFFEVDAVFSPHKIPQTSSELNSLWRIPCTSANSIDVEKELFLWAILTGKQELALLFWSRGKNKVCKSN